MWLVIVDLLVSGGGGVLYKLRIGIIPDSFVIWLCETRHTYTAKLTIKDFILGVASSLMSCDIIRKHPTAQSSLDVLSSACFCKGQFSSCGENKHQCRICSKDGIRWSGVFLPEVQSQGVIFVVCRTLLPYLSHKIELLRIDLPFLSYELVTFSSFLRIHLVYFSVYLNFICL